MSWKEVLQSISLGPIVTAINIKQGSTWKEVDVDSSNCFYSVRLSADRIGTRVTGKSTSEYMEIHPPLLWYHVRPTEFSEKTGRHVYLCIPFQSAPAYQESFGCLRDKFRMIKAMEPDQNSTSEIPAWSLRYRHISQISNSQNLFLVLRFLFCIETQQLNKLLNLKFKMTLCDIWSVSRLFPAGWRFSKCVSNPSRICSRHNGSLDGFVNFKFKFDWMTDYLAEIGPSLPGWEF